jgi:hypothetical protein
MDLNTFSFFSFLNISNPAFAIGLVFSNQTFCLASSEKHHIAPSLPFVVGEYLVSFFVKTSIS